MHAGRKSPLARAYREHAMEQARRGSDGPPLEFEETLERFQRPDISRRDLLKAGGLLGAGVALAACTPAAEAKTPKRGSLPDGPATDARVVIVGAGLAGLAAAYQLNRVGVPVQVYEARDRVGGRCWTSRGWADGQTAEHGGEFIDSRHVHIRKLAKQLGLKLDDLWSGYDDGASYPRWSGGDLLPVSATKPVMARIYKKAAKTARRIGVLRADGTIDGSAISFPTATPEAVALDALSMADWLERHVDGVLGTPVGAWLDEVMSGWYGLNMSELSAVTWMDYSVIPVSGADERWHVRGGNDQVTTRAAEALPMGSLHVDTALTSLRRRSDDVYELDFEGVASPVLADIVILTLPFTTLRRVDTSRAGFDAHMSDAIANLNLGYDVKLLLQYDRRPSTFHHWSGGMEYADPDFDTWESSLGQPGRSGLITVYAGGRTGASWKADRPHQKAPATLRDDIVGRIDQVVPGTKARFNGRAWTDLWTIDPWTMGAYAAFGPGQYTKFWDGLSTPSGNVHWAGEATSTYSQGYLNGGVESGDRVAEEVMRKLGVPVPRGLASLPH